MKIKDSKEKRNIEAQFIKDRAKAEIRIKELEK